ncbi:hypothetical protein J3459_016328 [Metarhizium acridum]|nr:hypothetical protein J3459_016328 [Metarhizium acridum]
MQTFGAFIASLAVAGDLAAALPAAGQTQTLSINAVHNKNFKPNGPLALAKAYNKYNVPLPAELSSLVSRIEEDLGLQKRQGGGPGTGSDPTKPPPGVGDLEYLAEVDIGTPLRSYILTLILAQVTSGYLAARPRRARSTARGFTTSNPAPLPSRLKERLGPSGTAMEAAAAVMSSSTRLPSAGWRSSSRPSNLPRRSLTSSPEARPRALASSALPLTSSTRSSQRSKRRGSPISKTGSGRLCLLPT